MGGEVPELVELAKLQADYREAIEDVASMDISDMARVVKMLEIEARFLGAIEACREAVASRLRGEGLAN